MKQSPADDCLYIGQRDGEVMYLLLYVNDGLVISKLKSALDSFLEDLKNAFKIKISEPRYFVGFKLERNRDNRSFRIHQLKYINKLLERFKINDAKEMSVPMDPNTRVFDGDESSDIERKKGDEEQTI